MKNYFLNIFASGIPRKGLKDWLKAAHPQIHAN
jgi:hypothetical protein